MRKIYGLTNYWWLFVIAAGFITASLWAQEDANRSEPLRNRVYALHYITAAQAREYLDRLKLGQTVSQVPQSNALIVTALPTDLVKVSSVIDLLDSKQAFVIDRLGPAGMPIPPAKQIMQKNSDISVGTFMDPPSHAKKIPIIVDTLNDNTILISPEGMSDSIISLMNQLKSGIVESNESTPAQEMSKITESKIAEPNETNKEPAVAGVNTPPAARPAKEPNEEELLSTEVNELLSQANHKSEMPTIAAPNEPAELNAEANLPVETEAAVPAEPNIPAEITPETEIPAETNIPVEQAPEAAVPPEPNIPVEAPAEPVPVEGNVPAEEIVPQEESSLKPAIPDEEQAKEQVRAQETKPTESQAQALEPASIPRGEEQLTLQLPETLDIVALLDLVGKYLNINYLYDPTQN